MKLAFGLLAAVALHAAPAILYYVAPNGSDQNTGKLNSPFATIEHARDVVRGSKHAATPVTIYLRGGTYRLTEPLHFLPQDSGTEDGPIAYAAYKDEHPVISGGRRIEGWQQATLNGKQTTQLKSPTLLSKAP